ncbi:MAG: hypothetical protein UR43_C0004G0148 [candidate division TM6 bacterium GW2011_GWF2_33_332]|nr:MAG: hypothetical protein UR43_C0004G0148 [candidate division TM6 bacterium GW2011_GWF2_33_332]
MSDSHKISFVSAVLMNINIIVGSGIYLSPPLMAQQAGGLSFLGWILAGLLLLPIVLTIANAARIFPGEGGFYNYCKAALGEDFGFIANWAYLLGYMGTVATITSGIRDLLINPLGFNFIKEYPIVFYVFFILIITLLNMISIRVIGKIQSMITLLKLIPLLVMLGVIYFFWNSSFDYQIDRISDLAGTIPLVLFSFLGFESCCNIGHHIRGGTAQVFKVILIAFSTSVLLYTVFHLGILQIMGSVALASQGVHAFPKFMGFSAVTSAIVSSFLLFDMMLSYMNTTYGAALNNITNINIFAKCGLLFRSKFLSKLNASGMPSNAAIVHGILIILLVTCVPSVTILVAITVLHFFLLS